MLYMKCFVRGVDQTGIASSSCRFCMGDFQQSTAMGMLLDLLIYRFICTSRSLKQ